MSAIVASQAAWVTGVLLLSLRLSAVLLLTPLLAGATVPGVVRALLVLGLSALVALGLPAGVVATASGPPTSPGALVQGGLTELALGATLALGIHVAFASFAMAGELLGIQMGFGLAQAVDPGTAGSVPLLSSALGQAGVLVFFLADGHHALLRGVAYGLERFPLGRPWPLDAAAGPVLAQVASLFTLGFALAAPVVLCLLLLELALGIVARNLPQLNMIALGFPVKIVVGLLALALWIGGAGQVMGRVYGGIFTAWDAVFRTAAAADPSGAGRAG